MNAEKMARRGAALVSLGLAVVLAGCGSGEVTAEGTDETTEVSEALGTNAAPKVKITSLGVFGDVAYVTGTATDVEGISSVKIRVDQNPVVTATLTLEGTVNGVKQYSYYATDASKADFGIHRGYLPSSALVTATDLLGLTGKARCVEPDCP
jgi:hypothetical protein